MQVFLGQDCHGAGSQEEARVRPAAVMPAQAQEGDYLQDQEGGARILRAKNNQEDEGKL